MQYFSLSSYIIAHSGTLFFTLQEGIKTPPVTFSELAKLIRRRIAANPDIPHITVDDQQTLVSAAKSPATSYVMHELIVQLITFVL